MTNTNIQCSLSNQGNNMWKLVFLMVSTMVVGHQLYNIDHLVQDNLNAQIAAAANPQKQMELMVELQKLINNPPQELEYLVKQNHKEQV